MKSVPSITSSIYTTRHMFPKWNRTGTVVDEPRLMKRMFAGWTSADHKHAAKVQARLSNEHAKEHGKVYADAAAKYGESGPLISGIFYAGNFPDSVKDKLRKEARLASDLITAAHAHWRASGSRSPFPYNPPGGWSYSQTPKSRKNPSSLEKPRKNPKSRIPWKMIGIAAVAVTGIVVLNKTFT